MTLPRSSRSVVMAPTCSPSQKITMWHSMWMTWTLKPLNKSPFRSVVSWQIYKKKGNISSLLLDGKVCGFNIEIIISTKDVMNSMNIILKFHPIIIFYNLMHIFLRKSGKFDAQNKTNSLIYYLNTWLHIVYIFWFLTKCPPKWTTPHIPIGNNSWYCVCWEGESFVKNISWVSIIQFEQKTFLAF